MSHRCAICSFPLFTPYSHHLCSRSLWRPQKVMLEETTIMMLIAGSTVIYYGCGVPFFVCTRTGLHTKNLEYLVTRQLDCTTMYPSPTPLIYSYR